MCVKLQIFDRGGEGRISQSDTFKALYHTLAMPSEEALRVFQQIDMTGRGYITFGKCMSDTYVHDLAKLEPRSIKMKDS